MAPQSFMLWLGLCVANSCSYSAHHQLFYQQSKLEIHIDNFFFHFRNIAPILLHDISITI
ncbi:BgtTE-56024 [Blumeria graminis f. sp. tritici]|uniref:BgtTE-56024 n=1 Tax=Blumeria graminis f. sp. tritici TaxID=62690 RepID=A0A9X9LB16_BLUGR|nr:BgtTE-56024 [Blumeria graminis f. sp. tritici]